jgi:hypothetical protein
MGSTALNSWGVYLDTSNMNMNNKMKAGNYVVYKEPNRVRGQGHTRIGEILLDEGEVIQVEWVVPDERGVTRVFKSYCTEYTKEVADILINQMEK